MPWNGFHCTDELLNRWSRNVKPPSFDGEGVHISKKSKKIKKLLEKLVKMCYNTLRKTHKKENAPLAQLVEQLTLNQWVQGSSPWRCTKRKKPNFSFGFFLFAIGRGSKGKRYRADFRWTSATAEDRARSSRENRAPGGASYRNNTNLSDEGLVFFFTRDFFGIKFKREE